MTREEALIYLPLEDEDERDDLYEEKLFECKQFLINRFPIGKVIKSRMDKFLKVEEAYIALGGSIKQFSVENNPENQRLSASKEPIFPSLSAAFDWYHAERNALKLKLNQAQSAGEMNAYLQELLMITKVYAAQWRLDLMPSDPNPIASQEPDPMELQAAFKLVGAQEPTRETVEKLAEDHVLKLEAKRLSFWLKAEG